MFRTKKNLEKIQEDTRGLTRIFLTAVLELFSSIWLRFTEKLQNNFGLVLTVVVVAFLTWGSATAMTKNWELARMVDAKKRERALLQIENELLELENKYYASEEYQELAARKQHGKILEGETMVMLPRNSETAKNKYKKLEMTEPESLSNFEQWLAFLFGWKKLQ